MSIAQLVTLLISATVLVTVSAPARASGPTTVAVGNVVPGLPAVRKQITTWRDMRYQHMVRQEKDYTCGAAALATILQQVFGHAVSEREIIEDMLRNTDERLARERGFSMLDMKNYVERNGLRAHGYRVDADRLQTLKIPVIALQNARGYAHFVVIKRVHAGMVYIADPALGHRQMRLDEFAAGWNGIVLAVVGDGLRPHNALLESATSTAAPRRAEIVTRILPPQKEFGLLGLDTF